jgi:CubicO group peptidase (beta-lactamase class C family)
MTQRALGVRMVRTSPGAVVLAPHRVTLEGWHRMHRRDFTHHMLALLGVAPLSAAVPRTKLDDAAALFEQQVEVGQLRAATLHVRQGRDTFQRAFGEATTPDAIFLIASISKPMTAAGVMLLADRGELTLDDPVHKFIPEFSDGDRTRITIRHLLTHTSGLPDQLPENTELRQRRAPLKEFVERALRTPLLFKPGERYSYQSMGILLAAEVAERITSQPFPRFLEREIFRPLGMDRTAMDLGRFSISDTMTAQVEYSAPEGGGDDSSAATDWNWNSPYWRGLGAPWGGAHSTGPDIARLLDSFLEPDGTVLKPETARSMIANQTPHLDERRGLGFALGPAGFGKHCSAETFGHGGSTGTLAWADPATGVTCVILTTLPARVSNALLLRPASDLVSEAA